MLKHMSEARQIYFKSSIKRDVFKKICGQCGTMFVLSFQCLWKVVRNLPKTISEVKVDQILLDIHTFLLTHPDQMWKNRADDTPLRTIKTILYTLGKLKKQEVCRYNLTSYFLLQ